MTHSISMVCYRGYNPQSISVHAPPSALDAARNICHQNPTHCKIKLEPFIYHIQKNIITHTSTLINISDRQNSNHSSNTSPHYTNWCLGIWYMVCSRRTGIYHMWHVNICHHAQWPRGHLIFDAPLLVQQCIDSSISVVWLSYVMSCHNMC